MKLNLKKTFKRLLFLLFFVLAIIIILNVVITKNSSLFIYDDLGAIPENKTGLLLGTSKYLSNGSSNYYFEYRIDAAIALYKAGKIKYIVVSGDNSRNTYNEPQQMKEDLIAGGVPSDVIYLDYAGFRTLDSVVRMNEIFGQTAFTIISQKFHNERAVYIAKKQGLNVCAYNARDVDKYMGFKTNMREKLARVKVFIDMITHKQPKFLGEKININ
jgi:SanA protein